MNEIFLAQTSSLVLNSALYEFYLCAKAKYILSARGTWPRLKFYECVTAMLQQTLIIES